jgi:hypothetical protein
MSVSKEMRLTWLASSVAVCAFAQNTATITGRVTDMDGVALGKAAIQATNTATKAVYKATSLDTGAYTLAQLPAGSYDLLAIVPGLLPYRQQNVVVQAGQSLRLEIRIQDFANLNTLGDGREFIADLLAHHKTPTGPAPRTANGKPDLSGVWLGSLASDRGKPEPLPWVQTLLKERAENNSKDWPMGNCLPLGPVLFGTFFPYRVLQAPNIVVMIDESDTPGYRQIFLDGRAHPKNFDPTWLGHSIGHWEKDTLVVDTVGLNGRAWLDVMGHPMTEKTHLTERYRRPDLGHLEVDYTIDDSSAYAKPWTIKRVSDLAPKGEEVGEYICTENNKDPAHLVGK